MQCCIITGNLETVVGKHLKYKYFKKGILITQIFVFEILRYINLIYVLVRKILQCGTS